MNFNNLDKTPAFGDIRKLGRLSLKNNVTAQRSRTHSASAATDLTYT